MRIARVFRRRCPAECRVVWYGGGLPMEAIRTRTERAEAGGIAGDTALGLRIRSGEGMIGEIRVSLLEGRGLMDIMGLTARRLTTYCREA